MIEAEQIKQGERYTLELLCILNKDNEIFVFETPTGDHIPISKNDIECISPEEKKSESKGIFSKRNCYRCLHSDGCNGAFCILHGKPSGEPCESFALDMMCMNCKHWKKRIDPRWGIDGICTLQDNFPMWHNDAACNNFNGIDD